MGRVWRLWISILALGRYIERRKWGLCPAVGQSRRLLLNLMRTVCGHYDRFVRTIRYDQTETFYPILCLLILSNHASHSPGYLYNFPFLHESCGIVVEDNCVEPLYKHVVNMNHPSMCFIGVPYYVCAFSMFDLQVNTISHPALYTFLVLTYNPFQLLLGLQYQNRFRHS